ncbi:MAG: thioredoxin family protein [Limisphaerales bacterium]
MARTYSTMLELGTPAPDFTLPDFNGRMYSLKDFHTAPALLVMFICNHCPYVKHIQSELVKFCKEYQSRGVAIVGINSNDYKAYPEDNPEKMAEVARSFGYTFPYLIDETQQIAKAYKAACTPDFFLFDGSRRLYYRGQFDDSRPKVDNPLPVTGKDLRQAIESLLAGKPAPENQKPSMGCNIKWKPGNEPDYFNI